jgi:hypothetical protein
MTMFKDKLYSISKELELHHRSRSEVMSSAVSERLNESLISYMDSVTKSYEYLRNRGEVRVLDKMGRRRKRNDKTT